MDTKRYIVIGRVQGVGYRWFVHKHAIALGISGRVRNRSDGTVEIWAEAPSHILAEFEDLLRSGPPSAYVRELRTQSAAPQNMNGNFDITY